MTFSILISPSRGFWSDEDGWVTHCTEASKLPVDAPIQVSFSGVRDILRINSKKVSTLNTDQVSDWLNLNFENLTNEVKDINCVNSIIECVNKHTRYILIRHHGKGISVIDTSDPLTLEKAPLISPFLRRL